MKGKAVDILKGPAGWVLVIGVGALAVWFIGRKLTGAAKDAAAAVANVNAGTPYAGTGPIGTLGHATDVASGGLFSAIGEWLGGKVADMTLPDFNGGPATDADAKNFSEIAQGKW